MRRSEKQNAWKISATLNITILVLAPVHELIHAVDEDTICSYLSALKLDASQLAKLNKLRILANRKPIDLENLNLTNNSHNGMTKETKKTV